MKKVISFAAIILLAGVATAGTVKLTLSELGPAPTESPVMGIPEIACDLIPGSVRGSLYLWVDTEGSNLVHAMGVDVTSTDPGVVRVTGMEVFSSEIPAGFRWNGSDWVADVPGGKGAKTVAAGGGARGLQWDFPASVGGEGDYGDIPSTMLLFARIDYECVGRGQASLIMSQNGAGIVESGSQISQLLFGGGEPGPVPNSEGRGVPIVGQTGSVPDAIFTIPEPSTAILALLGLFGLVPFARRK